MLYPPSVEVCLHRNPHDHTAAASTALSTIEGQGQIRVGCPPLILPWLLSPFVPLLLPPLVAVTWGATFTWSSLSCCHSVHGCSACCVVCAHEVLGARSWRLSRGVCFSSAIWSLLLSSAIWSLLLFSAPLWRLSHVLSAPLGGLFVRHLAACSCATWRLCRVLGAPSLASRFVLGAPSLASRFVLSAPLRGVPFSAPSWRLSCTLLC